MIFKKKRKGESHTLARRVRAEKSEQSGKGEKTTTIKAGKNHKHICYVAKTKKKRGEFHHLLRKAPTVVEGIREKT